MLLNCHSYFSLRYGMIPEKDLLELCVQNDYNAMALTDINNTSGCLNFIRLAEKYDIKPIVGIDFRNGIQQKFVGLAKNNTGFQELNEYLSKHSHQKLEFPDQAPMLENVFFIYPFEQLLKTKKEVFRPNEYIGISIKDLNRVQFSTLRDRLDKFVILHPVTFRHKKDFSAHRLLRSIDENTLLSKISGFGTGEETEQILPSNILKYHFKNFDSIIHNTEKLMDECHIHFTFGENREHQNLKIYTQSEAEDYQRLRQKSYDALGYRYGDNITDQIFDRISMELEMIQKQNFIPFFLVNHDIVSYARQKGYFYVGRGSGANSIVAYLLGITNVDPIELDLYFERFINIHRKNPPDFDIDFSWKDREDITDYIFKKFGTKGQAALLGTYSTFQHSAAVRELGKVFGLPTYEIDALSDGKYDPKKLDQLSGLVIKYAQYFQENNQPNHLSIHAGGILISERPINYFSATDLPPKGFPTTQFDMVIAEDVGLNKYDILSQRGLAKIKETLEIIKYNRPDAPEIDIDDVKQFKLDPKINNLIKQAQCIGCFYVESPAMRMLLKKLEVDNYLGLVAASSIIRPGVAKSGMMREYILRHQDHDRAKDAHPILLDLMPETYGIMVYQEDVIKVAHYFAGLTLGEADVIRRGMSGKFRGRDEFEFVKAKFFKNCKNKKYDPIVTGQIWAQIASFAGYAFAKGHSASYAVESYQTLFLKAYYPLEFMVAVLNNGGGFYGPELYVHEARMMGANVLAPCVNHSNVQAVIKGTDIYLGMSALNEIEEKTIIKIIEAREAEGDFTSLNNFLDRVAISIEQITILIRIDAFRFTKIDKKTLLWKAHFRLNKAPQKVPQKQLFQVEVKEFDLPKFETSPTDEAYDQIELLGFPLCSPFDLVKNPMSKSVMSKDLHQYINQDIIQYGYLVAVKNTRTSKGERMQFGTFLDQEGQFIDTVHFPQVAAKYNFSNKGVYKIYGKVIDEFGFLSIEVTEIVRMDLSLR
ncbi:DNA polymerase III subunit alpha [Dyadobacter frigoris]|uniref:DNA polymerase III subunit alpha n=1 Tax=Dyadobacter frigoris TaxID=2576211 RepID=A0A4V6BIT2_9BACT|nr:DNA polymerase III subunit alpha [Dyadobacter frigoris]TKT91633.1 DNA polymerase III subunit alpha [Dyadobacter frigoris]GLU51803.1 DNA-directed DNA polymerase [Dyadobacter frigoris]